MIFNRMSIGQMTPAAQLAVSQMNGGRRAAPKRRRRAAATAAPKRRRLLTKPRGRARSAARPARMVKGSAAAKRYMASLRKRRRR